MGGDEVMCEICGYSRCVPRCPNYIPATIGCCEQCHEPLYDAQPVWTDNEQHTFCSEECAEEFHEIKEIDS